MITMEQMVARQQPFTTGFGYRTTAEDVVKDIDFSGQHAVVTGGYSGLGLETVRVLTSRGTNVVVPARNGEKATKALEGIDNVEILPMDLADLESVSRFCELVRERGHNLDLIINAAGIMATPHGTTAQGWELQFGTNHLGHFAMIGGLDPLLVSGSRVVSYSSIAHWWSPVVFDDINFETRDYEPWAAYGQSKSANALFAVALNDRMSQHGMLAYSLHPGGIMTDLQRHMPKEDLLERGWIDEDGNANPMFKTIPEGAATGMWAATAPELEERGGVYLEDCSIKGIVSAEESDYMVGGVKEWAINPDFAEQLWSVSVEATGLDPLATC